MNKQFILQICITVLLLQIMLRNIVKCFVLITNKRFMDIAYFRTIIKFIILLTI